MILAKPRILFFVIGLALFFSSVAWAANSSDTTAPRIISIRPEPQTKTMLLTIQDPPGALSYDIEYANSLSSTGATTAFILCQRDYPVSGQGTTQWRDDGSSTKVRPLDPSIRMRFYRFKVNRSNTSAPQIIITSPQDGEVIGE